MSFIRSLKLTIYDSNDLLDQDRTFFLTNIKTPHLYSPRHCKLISTQEMQGVREKTRYSTGSGHFLRDAGEDRGKKNAQETECNPLCCAVVHIVCVGGHVVCVGNTRVSYPEPNGMRHR